MSRMYFWQHHLFILYVALPQGLQDVRPMAPKGIAGGWYLLHEQPNEKPPQIMNEIFLNSFTGRLIGW